MDEDEGAPDALGSEPAPAETQWDYAVPVADADQPPTQREPQLPPPTALERDHERLVRERRHSLGPMPVLTFAVTKVNQRKRRQARLLKLSDTAVENIRAKTGQPSSIFPYETVSKVVANSISQFTVHYLHAKHPYVYESHVAIQIVHELSLRVNAARERNLGSRFRVDLHQQRLLGEGQGSLAAASGLRTSIRRLSMGGDPGRLAAVATAEERLTALVWYVVNEKGTEEWSAVRRFLQSERHSVGAVLAHNARAFLDGLRFHFLRTRAVQVAQAAGPNQFTGADADFLHQQMVQRFLEGILEVATLPPLLARLALHFDATSREADERFLRGCAALAGRSQAAMRIAPALCSSSEWAAARAALRELDAQELPCEVLECLLDAVRRIYREPRPGPGSGPPLVVGGDAFLDILVYVAVHAGLRRPHHKLQYAWALCDPDELHSEGGYYLTVFESALTYIASQGGD